MDNSRQPIGLNPFTQVNDFYKWLMINAPTRRGRSLNPFTQVNDFYDGKMKSEFTVVPIKAS